MPDVRHAPLEAQEAPSAAVERAAHQTLFNDAYRDVDASRTQLSQRNLEEERGRQPAECNSQSVELGNIWQQLGIEEGFRNLIRRATGEATQPVEPTRGQPRTEDQARDTAPQRTHIRVPDLTGRLRDVEVSIEPDRIRDHLGTWTRSETNTWTSADGTNQVRRGNASIDAQGNYIFEDSDYGVTTLRAPDGTTTRLFRTNGQTYSVTRNAAGEPIAFCDQNGEWRRGESGAWINQNNRDLSPRSGSPEMTSWGSFSFRAGDGTITPSAQSPELRGIEQERENIRRDFGVNVAVAGRRWTQNGDIRGLVADMPTLAELQTLRAGLSAYVVDGRRSENHTGMTVWFIRSQDRQTDDDSTYGEMWQRGPGQARHVCTSGGCHSVAASPEATRGRAQAPDNGNLLLFPRSRTITSGYEGLEGTVRHELDHHRQGQRSGHRLENSESTVLWRQRAETRDLAARHGWTLDASGRQFVLRDVNGTHWRPREDGGSEFTWAGGATPRGSTTITAQEMRERALVRPATSYSPYPWEGEAEAMAMFNTRVPPDQDQRLDVPPPSASGRTPGLNRRTLAIDSPTAYRLAQQTDAETINTPYIGDVTRRLPWDEMHYVRDLDGRIFENTLENRHRLENVRQVQERWLQEGDRRESERIEVQRRRYRRGHTG